MRYKVGIFGSGAGDIEVIREKAEQLGDELAKKKPIIITGACSGIPYIVANRASKGGCDVWGYSPEIDLEHQKLFVPKDDLSIYTKLIYIPADFPFIKVDSINKKYRNIMSTANCDAGIIVSGRWGTMNEFTNLFDMGKINRSVD